MSGGTMRQQLEELAERMQFGSNESYFVDLQEILEAHPAPAGGERGPFDIADRVTGANMGYFVGALNFVMRRDGAISAAEWNDCIAAAVEFGAREQRQR